MVLAVKAQENVQVAQAEAPHLRQVKWWKEPHLRKLYMLCAVIILSSATTGFDGSMMNGLQMLDQWQVYFNYPKGSILGFFSCVMGIGAFCGLPFAPYLSDYFGRRISIAIGTCIMCLGVALQTAANGFSMFVAGRFFIGFGCNIAQASAPLLLTELCHPQHRGPVTAIYNTTWHVGSIIATWTTYGTFKLDSNWAWRLPSLLQAAPSVIQLFFLFFVPESPRWLINKDRPDDALKVLTKYHGGGNGDDPTVRFEYQEILETIELEKSAARTGWLEFIRTKGNRHRLAILGTAGLFSQWSGNGLVSYYFTIILDNIGVTNPDTQFKINGALGIYSWAFAITFALLCDYFGRRPLFLTSTASMLVVFTIWTICSAQFEMHGTDAASKAVLAMIFLYSTAYNFAWSGLLVAYSVEILPYYMRAKGLMIMNVCVQIALVFNQYVNPIGLGHLKWKYYIFYCVWIAIELIVVFLIYVETKGPTLEEIAKIFDGEDAAVAHVHLKDSDLDEDRTTEQKAPHTETREVEHAPRAATPPLAEKH